MTTFQNTRWIWLEQKEDFENQFVCFKKSFELQDLENGKLTISADSDFVVYINGVEIGRRQFSDWPEHKTYTEFAVNNILRKGRNTVSVLAYYCGAEFQTYTSGKAGMLMVLKTPSVEITTNKSWKCIQHPAFQSGPMPKLTVQLGFTMKFDARHDVDWVNDDFDDSQWKQAEERGKSTGDYWQTLTARPVPSLLTSKAIDSSFAMYGVICREKEFDTFAQTAMNDFQRPLSQEEMFENPAPVTCPAPLRPLCSLANGYFIIADLGGEYAGLLEFDIGAAENTILDISHGEHLIDGRVRMKIGYRNFTDRYICKTGNNHFLMPFRRIAGRYIQINITNVSGPVIINYIGLRPRTLPLHNGVYFSSNSALVNKMHNVGVNTLKLCMHEHYEDCPWREQALYAYDSRNQALFGYYVWGNYDFAATSFKLLGNSMRSDGLLELCAPCHKDITIPIFSFAWVTALYEHQMHSGAMELFNKFDNQIEFMIQKILNKYDPNSKLYKLYKGKEYWNFYEWALGMNESESSYDELHICYNLYFHEMLSSYAKMLINSGKHLKAEKYYELARQLAKAINLIFWDESNNIYATKFIDGTIQGNNATVQFLTLYQEIVPKNRIIPLLESIFKDKLIPTTLSSMSYMLRAMMSINSQTRQYASHIISEYFGPMILSGTTSMWETQMGAGDFSGAGSLCHGWSSLPVYYYHAFILGIHPIEPGFKKFSISPYSDNFKNISGTVATPYGIIETKWQQTDKGIKIEINGPENLSPIVNPYPEVSIASVTWNGYRLDN